MRAERGRPYAPGYGIPTNAKGLLPWSFVEERMVAARDYWVATVHPADDHTSIRCGGCGWTGRFTSAAARRHARPVTSPRTRA